MTARSRSTHRTHEDSHQHSAPAPTKAPLKERNTRVNFRPRGSSASLAGPTLDPRTVRLLAGICAVFLLVGVAWAVASAIHRTSSTGISQSVVAPTGPSLTQKSASAAQTAHKNRRHKKKTHVVSSSTAKAVPASKATKATKASASSSSSHSSGSTSVSSAISSLARGATVVIDAGHQAVGDPSLEPIGPGASEKKPKVADGASGQYAPHDESEINLEIALKLASVLKARGVKVIMVRTKQNVNIANSKRAAIANSAHAALFIRLHCDGISDTSKHGCSTLIPAKNHWTSPIVSASAKAGRLVQSAALANTGAADAGVVNRGDLAGFNWSKVPTILVEMGFLSNAAEDKKLTTPSYQQKMAVGLSNGVIRYLESR